MNKISGLLQVDCKLATIQNFLTKILVSYDIHYLLFHKTETALWFLLKIMHMVYLCDYWTNSSKTSHMDALWSHDSRNNQTKTIINGSMLFPDLSILNLQSHICYNPKQSLLFLPSYNATQKFESKHA